MNNKKIFLKRFHSPLLEWLSSKTPSTTNVGEDMGEKELSYIVGGNAN
jgi:hypothetical protein